MPIIRDLNQLPDSALRGAVAIGNFDGVHRGHLEIVRRLLERARELGGPAIVFTFDPHPVQLLRPAQCPPPLTWTERKAELLAAHGVYMVVAYHTDEQLLRLSAKEFFDKIVVGALNARAMVEGPNFYFGHDREGNVELLAKFAEAAGITLDIVSPVTISGELVSSSRIRSLIAGGDVALAGELLSAPYRIRGMVTHGVGRGSTIGFPTANLQGIDTLLPKPGVYAGRAIVQSILYPAAINLGPNPTFGETTQKVEIHLLDYHDSLYGQPLEVEFLARLRDVIAFDSPATLVNQLQQDIKRTREIAAQGIAVEQP